MAFEATLWRAIAVYRAASLVYAAALIGQHYTQYAHPLGGWLVLGVMAAWTAFATYAYADPAKRRWPLLAADIAVAVACLLATGWVESLGRLLLGAPNLPVSWVAAAVLAWAVATGRRGGTIAAVLVALADFLLRLAIAEPTQGTFSGAVLLLLAGFVGGHVARLAVDAEARLARAVELEAATRERERLARGIHDSVLQVLSLVQRRGGELGGEAAELGRLAGEQEAALRALIGSGHPGQGGDADLGALLTGSASTTVTVSMPATPVRLPARAAAEVAAAVGAALDNVRRHCGPETRAWVLVEDAADHVIVSVRDDGPGIPPDRLEQAAADGRLGVAQSIRGRIEDLGGTVTVASAPGQGTEIEMTIPAKGLRAAYRPRCTIAHSRGSSSAEKSMAEDKGDKEATEKPEEGAQEPERETTAEQPAAEHQEGAPPPPVAAPPRRFGRARDWSRRKPAQLLAAGLAGVIIGGVGVGTVAALTGDDRPSPRDSRYYWRGPGPYRGEPGPYGWQGPRHWGPPDDEARPWWGGPDEPRFRRLPPGQVPSPAPTPSAPSATPTA